MRTTSPWALARACPPLGSIGQPGNIAMCSRVSSLGLLRAARETSCFQDDQSTSTSVPISRERKRRHKWCFAGRLPDSDTREGEALPCRCPPDTSLAQGPCSRPGPRLLGRAGKHCCSSKARTETRRGREPPPRWAVPPAAPPSAPHPNPPSPAHHAGWFKLESAQHCFVRNPLIVFTAREVIISRLQLPKALPWRRIFCDK